MIEFLYPDKLENSYTNLVRVEDNEFIRYVVSNNQGSDVGQICYMDNHEWRFEVDNYPHPKKWFTTNVPVYTIEQFQSIIDRIDLRLEKA